MKKLTVITAFLAVVFVGCKKDTDELNLTRRFAPATISSKNGETSVVLTWAASLFTITGEVEYVVEVSKDVAFGNVEYTVTTSDVTTTVTDDKIGIKQDYFARVKAVGKNASNDSKWLVSTAFRITGEQFLNQVTTTTVTDVAVQLTWRPNPALTKIVITPATGSPTEYVLTSGDKTASLKEISGLNPQTTYTAEIFQDTKSKGVITFKTKAALTGNVVEVTGTDLAGAITAAPSGSTLLLQRGQQYVFSAAFSFSKSVTIMSKFGFGTNYAAIRISVTGLNMVAASTIDSLVFRDLVIKGGRALNASYDNDYIINASTASTVDRIRLDNCVIKIFRGVVRQNGASVRFNNYIVNNCVIDSVKDFSVAQVSAGLGFGTIRITNSTVYKSRKIINSGVVGSTSVLIENCTFNETPSNNGTNYFIDYNAQNVTNGITIKNCIIGKTWDEGGAITPIGYRAGSNTSLTITSSYATSDFVLASGALVGLTSYSGASTALFTNPAAGNFTIKDATFVGRSTTGDPRWRIQ